MSTITLKRSFWKDFERTQTWKCIFWVLDSILTVITYPVFFFLVLIFQDHSAKSAWGFYSPMLLVLGFILAFTSLVMYNYTSLSWLAVAGIGALIAIALFACVAHPIWSDEYREKMGYPRRFS
jgi:hypothetical protein